MQHKDQIKFHEYFKILDTNTISLVSNNNFDKTGFNKIIEQPTDITLPLKKYQRTMIYEMFLREQKQGFFISRYNFLASNIGILGESVGSGKTLTTLGLIAFKKLHKFYYPENPASFIRYQVIKKKLGLDSGNYSRDDFIKSIMNYIPSYCTAFSIMDDFYLKRPDNLYIPENVDYKTIKNIPTNLIVLPHNLIRQWKNDIEKYTKLSYFFISNIRHLRKIKEEGVEKLSNYDIVLCNASKYNDFVELTKGYRWERVFFDEAHSINIPKSKFIYAKFYWFITATYKSIVSRRNTGFLTRLFTIYRRKLLRNRLNDFNKFILKTNPDCIKQEYNIAKPNKLYHISEKPLWINVIEDSIDSEFPNMKEMMYAELEYDIKQYLSNFGVLSAMSELRLKNVVLIYIKWLKSRENWQFDRAQVYEENLNHFMSNDDLRYHWGNRFQAEVVRKQNLIRKYNENGVLYANKRLSIKHKLESLQLCSLCIKPLVTYYNLSCHTTSHKICLGCVNKLKEWENMFSWANQCFICCDASNITINNTPHNINNIIERQKQYNTKLEHIYHLLKNPNKKFLIFSNFSSLFNKYLEEFKKSKIKYGILKGNNNVINKRLKDFKNGNTNVLLLNGKHYGSGLNLQDATDIIITHKISEDVETQVVGRANRMGRKGILNIHYIIFDTEIK